MHKNREFLTFYREKKLLEAKDFSDFIRELKPEKKIQCKLIMNPTNKQKWFLNYRIFEVLNKERVDIAKVYTVHHFAQWPCLIKFVAFNAEQIAQPGENLNFFQLMINASNGKTIKNKRKRKNPDMLEITDTKEIKLNIQTLRLW